MAKKMLIDATHAEETRVAVVDGHRLVEFDYESKVRKQLKGSIFLAKVTRVEPSLQAAFVNFGGNRHGFLPFSEIHPDYYRIPIADRQKLLAEEAAAMEAEEEAEEQEFAEEAAHEAGEVAEEEDEEADIIEEVGGEEPSAPAVSGSESSAVEAAEGEDDIGNRRSEAEFAEENEEDDARGNVASPEASDEEDEDGPQPGNSFEESGQGEDGQGEDGQGEAGHGHRGREHDRGGRGRRNWGRGRGGRDRGRRMPQRNRSVEIVGGDNADGEGPRRPNLRRQYKIQEVIKRGQIMLIQVSKEERGNKGAAVTTYLSLPGRYCVLMPNSPRGGGVSRKIASFDDRRRMKEILNELNVPEGMSVIMRTAGVARTKPEIKRDLDYMLRLWDNIRELTLKSSAPAPIYEEGDLIKRAIRDLYAKDTDEIHVSGAEGYKAARDFMKMLIPSHVKKVVEYKDEKIPLFHRYQVEQQISDIGEPSVTLRSGGYLVINPTEALVSIDVNSGRATKERHIEETALKTNLEAADEVARQLRLRDLGGLVVIDFIDMEDRRNNAKVERRLKDALSSDRARIQVGRISSFGLLELSRQRLNPSLTETQSEKCPHCKGAGYIKTVDSVAITALRAVEQEGIKGRASEITLSVPTTVALYILNNKRAMLVDLERRYDFRISIRTDESFAPAGYQIDMLAGRTAVARAEGEEGEEGAEETVSVVSSEEETRRPEGPRDGERRDGENRSSRRRGRRGGRRRNGDRPRREDGEHPVRSAGGQEEDSSPEESEAAAENDEAYASDAPVESGEAKRGGRGRGRGRGRGHPRQEAASAVDEVNETDAGSRRGSRGHGRRSSGSGENQEAAASDVSASPKSESQREISAPPAPSNDTRTPRASASYETVTEASPAQKKRGWWNKLME